MAISADFLVVMDKHLQLEHFGPTGNRRPPFMLALRCHPVCGGQ